MTKPLSATLGEIAGPTLERMTHPVTGETLVRSPRKRIVRGPAFVRRGKAVDLGWAIEQAQKLAAKGKDATRIAEVFATKGEVTRGDGSPVTAEDVKGWLRPVGPIDGT